MRRRWDELIERALEVHPHRPEKQTPVRNLALRLCDRREEFLNFTTDFTVAFSNNASEQAVRRLKVKPKCPAASASCKGDHLPGHTRLYLHRTQKRPPAAHALRDAFLGNPWMRPAPVT